LNTDFGIRNERQDCKIGTVCVEGECHRDEGEGIRWIGFIYMMKENDETSCNCLKWGGEGVI
jgi:hypothetical protein